MIAALQVRLDGVEVLGSTRRERIVLDDALDGTFHFKCTYRERTSGPNPRLDALLPQELQALARFVDPEHECSATARALIDPVLEELMS